jgi:histidinol-phosphate aminotransferase
MVTPTPSVHEPVERAVRNVKPEVRAMGGYTAPPRIETVAKLNQNENPYDLPDALKREILDAVRGQEWTRYPAYDPPDLRVKIARRFGLDPDQVLLGNGSNQLLYLLGSALVSPGDRVVTAPPTFSLFGIVAKIAHGRLDAIDQDADFTLDSDRLLAAVRGARLTFFCSPNNPTGRTIPTAFLEEVLCATEGIVVWDEAYGEFWGETALPLLERHPNLLVLKTFSKAFGLAGLRIGYLIGHPAMVSELRKVNIPYNINMVSRAAASALLDRPEWIAEQVARILAERDRLFDALRSVAGVIPFPSAANFILVRTPDSRAVFDGLKARGVLVRPVESHPLLVNCLRVTVGKPAENDAFLDTLKTILGHGSIG